MQHNIEHNLSNQYSHILCVFLECENNSQCTGLNECDEGNCISRPDPPGKYIYITMSVVF